MVGVDEVGRGCWAGPLLVVAAIAISDLPEGLTDSKLLNRVRREELFLKLQKSCKFGEGWVSAPEIDRKGLAACLRLGAIRALRALGAKKDDQILLDGKVNYLPRLYINAHAAIDADLSLPIVSAASIYGKVKRDKFMHQLAKKHPSYGFEKHVGYGTVLHRSALKSFGIVEKIHRTSYRPIREFMVTEG